MSDVRLGKTGQKAIDLAQTVLVIAIVIVLGFVLFGLVANGADWIVGAVLN